MLNRDQRRGPPGLVCFAATVIPGERSTMNEDVAGATRKISEVTGNSSFAAGDVLRSIKGAADAPPLDDEEDSGCEAAAFALLRTITCPRTKTSKEK